MKRTLFSISGAALVVIFSVSCVSGKKFTELEGTSTKFMKERDDYKTRNIALEMENKELKSKQTAIETEMGGIKEKITKVEAERDKAVDEFSRLSAKYADLQTAQEDLIRGNVKETQRLLSELQEAQTKLQEKEDLLRQL